MTHTHIFQLCGGGIRIIVRNKMPEMDWDAFFEANPEAGERIRDMLLKGVFQGER